MVVNTLTGGSTREAVPRGARHLWSRGLVTVIAVIGIPFVLLYTVGVYYIFRGKVRLAPDSY